MGNRRRIRSLLVIALSGMLLLTNCSRLSPEPTPDAPPPLEETFIPVVSATGVVVPARWATLSMVSSGTLEELTAHVGYHAEAGQVLARLEQRPSLETYEAAISAARLELISARQALDALYENADLLAAQAQKTLTEAQEAFDDAERRRNYLDYDRAGQDVIDAAEANFILAQNEVDQAQRDFNKVSGRSEDDPVRALALSNLAAAKQQRDALLRKLNWYKGERGEDEFLEADANLALAQAQLDDSLRRYADLQNGPDPEEVALAEARITNAEAQLAAAEAALSDLNRDRELKAPFTGMVTETFLRANEWVIPGQPVFTIADLSNLQVETTDMNEIDVARIETGDQATVTFDALPDVQVTGTVVRIAPKAAPGSGVNYTVVLTLDSIPARLLWGMTAFVDILVE